MHLTPGKRKAHLALGQFGEDTAVRLLEIKGYHILARNFRLKSGELDIVALDGLTIVFVEVKTRRIFPGVTPAWNLSLTQMRRNSHAGKHYLHLFGIPEMPCRCDLIEVTVDRRRPRRILELRHTLNLFPCP